VTSNVLLIGRTRAVIDDIVAQLHVPGFQLLAGAGIESVRSAFAEDAIDLVILGGGLDLETRLEIVREVFRLSSSTTVHMNSPSGPRSFLPFVRSVLNGMKDPLP
jgi:hypothetical protein